MGLEVLANERPKVLIYLCSHNTRFLHTACLAGYFLQFTKFWAFIHSVRSICDCSGGVHVTCIIHSIMVFVGEGRTKKNVEPRNVADCRHTSKINSSLNFICLTV